MKLVFQDDFTLEVGEKSYTGTLRELTKKERKDIESKQKAAITIVKKADALVSKIDVSKKRSELKEKMGEWSEAEKLVLSIEKDTQALAKLNAELSEKDFEEEIFKYRIELSLDGDDKKDILALCDEYSYKRVFETIQKDVLEKKS